MIVAIYDNDSGEYSICASEEFAGCSYHIDITQKFWERYNAYEAEREFIQSKLHSYYQAAKQHEIIKKSKDGIKPV